MKRARELRFASASRTPVTAQPPASLVGRNDEWSALTRFVASGEAAATLGIVWGRRRIGKSYLLQTLAEQTGGFYYEAQRGSSAEALRDLGERLGAFQGTAAPLALPSWEHAIDALLALGRDREILVVLDEFPYLLEHTPGIDSAIQRLYGPRQASKIASRTRLILCGSAMSVMGKLLIGTAPLRGRAGLDLRLSPFDFRMARELHNIADLATAFRTYAVIGGVAAYAREMSGNDCPRNADDFDRWICERVLSPSSPLFREVGLLLSEDPTAGKARKQNLYHATLAAVADGNHAWSTLANYVKITGASLTPIIEALVTAEFIARNADPVRDNRPTYHPADPLLRFHYALLRRRQSRLARPGADTLAIWRESQPTFNAQIVGPCFEDVARYWTSHYASPATLGGVAEHVGATTLLLADGAPCELDVVVADDDASTPSQRTIRAIGEAKAGATLSERHLERLVAARTALGVRAASAKLLLIGRAFAPPLFQQAEARRDVELIDLARLYEGE